MMPNKSGPIDAPTSSRPAALKSALLIATCLALAGIALAGNASALEAVGNCESGWRPYDDGNHYQCNPATGNGGPTTYQPGFDQQFPGGGGADPVGNAESAGDLPADIAGPPLSVVQLASLRATLPEGYRRVSDGPGDKTRDAQNLLFEGKLGLRSFMKISAWYRDAYARKVRTLPGRAGNDRVFCRVGPKVGSATQIFCNKTLIESAQCFDPEGPNPIRVTAGVATVVTRDTCVNQVDYVVVASPANGVVDVRDRGALFTASDEFDGEETIQLAGVSADGSRSAFEVGVRANSAPTCSANIDPLEVTRGSNERAIVSCSDPDGDDVHLVVVDQPSNGSASELQDGIAKTEPRIGHVSNDRYLGDDEFTVRAVDEFGRAASDATLVRLLVKEPAPVCSGYFQDFDEAAEGDIPVSVACGLPNGLPLLSPLKYALASSPSKGTISQFNEDSGTFTYTPKNKAIRGLDPVRFTATYAGKQANTATASLRASRAERE